MAKERFSTVLISGLTLTAILFVGIFIGKGGDQTGHASESYEELQVFAEVLSQVKKHYVEETKTKDLVQGALRGMLAGLDPVLDRVFGITSFGEVMRQQLRLCGRR